MAQQVIALGPAIAPLWVAGLWWLSFHPAGHRHRALGIIFVTVVVILSINGRSRPNYLAVAQPALIAAGALRVTVLPSSGV